MAHEVDDPVTILGDILRGIGATVTVDTDRLSRSTLYDFDYHFAVIACVFAEHATIDDAGHKSVVAGWLKLMQFVAARPRLAEQVLSWSANRLRYKSMLWHRIPRGYIGDEMHDAAVDFLVASEVLDRWHDRIIGGIRVQWLADTYTRICRDNLFKTERDVIIVLKTIRVNKTMLRGE
jgi:hypothetical protein